MKIIVTKDSREDELLLGAMRNDTQLILCCCGQELNLKVVRGYEAGGGVARPDVIYTLELEPSLSELETEIKAADEALTDLQKKYRRLTGKDYRWFK